MNIINVASTQIKISSLDGPSCSGGFTLKKHEKSLIGLTVSVSKLNKNIIKNGEHYLFQVQNKEFMSKNHGESLLDCPV